jgi:demethylmenaquinone methyltransferase/2-methoxy-6-polyprenyl-1,4-benzoquinol methylase
MTAEMAAYYRARAAEYERIYDRPERQGDLARLHEIVAAFARHRTMLEIACGTGYWTATAARTARAIVGIDASEETLAIARAKALGPHVSLVVGDAYALSDDLVRFDAAMANFWWSHIPLPRHWEFLGGLIKRLPPGAPLLMIDNRLVPGSSTPISRRDPDGTTYQVRQLSSGATFEIVKTFPTPDELRATLAHHFETIEVVELDYFWLATARRR